MAAVTTELKVLVRAVGKGEVDKLSKSLTALGKRAVEPANKQFRQLSVELKAIQRNSTQSIANLKGYRNAWRDITEQVEIGSREFRVATRNVERLDAQLKKVQQRQSRGGALGRIGGLRGAAKGAGAIAAGGVFGGVEGAAGAGIGLAVGGPAGAAVGAALGAQVGGIRQALGATADYSANLDKLRIALKGVTTSSEEYRDGLGFVQESTERFAIPQEILTRQFTKLQASVQGAGGNIEDTKTAFNGIVAAVRATGGSLADVDAALTATAQVFSKGKVSAEELRQQIGERLPGAFTLFAESMGLTPAELDKALEQGKVSLQDFQGFAEAIFKRYGENAETIAKSPKSAGDQLKVQLEQLNESVGRLLQPIGAFFQQTFGAIIKNITDATNALTRFLNLAFDEGKLAAAEARFEAAQSILDNTASTTRERQRALRSREEARKVITAQTRLRDAGAVDVQQPGASTGLPGIVTDPSGGGGGGRTPTDTSERMVLLQGRLGEAIQQQNQELIAQTQYLIRNEGIAIKFEEGKITATKRDELLQKSRNRLLQDGIKLRKQAKNAEVDLAEQTESVNEQFKKIGKTIKASVVDGLTAAITGAQSLGEALGNILRQAGSLFVSFGLKQLFPFLNADGNVYDRSGFVPFAKGGVVDKPTLFPFAKGIGLMGEAGPEAIMPLRRGPSGRLGVEAAGGGVGNVVVNVDASGSAVEGDVTQSKQLGNAIGAAVQAELIKQKRPGGLLAGV